jgi:hypothetical protein
MPDSTRLQELQPFIGRWATTIEMIEEGETSLHHATDVYRWALGKKFIFHDVRGKMGGQPIETLEIMSVKGPRNFDLRSYDNSGAIEDYTASLDGHDWRIDGAKLRFRGAFSRDWGTLQGTWERRGGDKWHRWLAIKLERSSEQ